MRLHSIVVALLFCFFNDTRPSRITLLVPIVASDEAESLPDFLYSLSKTANFYQIEVFILKNYSCSIKYQDIVPHILAYPNLFYIPLEREYTLGEMLNVGIVLSNSEYLIKGNVHNRYGQYFFEYLARQLDRDDTLEAVYSDVLAVEYTVKSFYQLYGAHNSRLLDLHFSDEQGLSAIMWRKSIHEERGYFSTVYPYRSDYEFWMRCLKKRLTHSQMHVLKIEEVLISEYVP